MREHVEELCVERHKFLQDLKAEEAQAKMVIEARRMRWAFHMAGWNNKGPWRHKELAPSSWMMDYMKAPPSTFVEGMFPLDNPNLGSMRVIKLVVDRGEYLPCNQLVKEFESTKSASWHGLKPIKKLLH